MTNKLKFELAGTGKSWKYQEISFPARRLRSLNLVDSYACCFFLCNECCMIAIQHFNSRPNDLDVDTMYEIRVKEALFLLLQCKFEM